MPFSTVLISNNLALYDELFSFPKHLPPFFFPLSAEAEADGLGHFPASSRLEKGGDETQAMINFETSTTKATETAKQEPKKQENKKRGSG